MIKDPLPCYWSAPENSITVFDHKHYTRYCRYGIRFNLPCFNPHKLKDCNYCYMKQQASRSADVIHICDRCGFVTNGADERLSYLTLTNRDGGLIAQAELCQACASQLGEWLKNEDFFKNFWGEDEEEPEY